MGTSVRKDGNSSNEGWCITQFRWCVQFLRSLITPIPNFLDSIGASCQVTEHITSPLKPFIKHKTRVTESSSHLHFFPINPHVITVLSRSFRYLDDRVMTAIFFIFPIWFSNGNADTPSKLHSIFTVYIVGSKCTSIVNLSRFRVVAQQISCKFTVNSSFVFRSFICI